MSRFQQWTLAESGLGNYASKFIELDFRGAGKPNKYYGVEIKKLINKFSKINKINGSYSERILQISNKHYQLWQSFIVQQSQTNQP
jgi:hypothetical protein